jgi:hypothetical protein
LGHIEKVREYLKFCDGFPAQTCLPEQSRQGDGLSQVGGYPTAARQEKQDDWGLTGTWTWVLSDSVVQEVKAGRYYYFFTHSPTVPAIRVLGR